MRTTMGVSSETVGTLLFISNVLRRPAISSKPFFVFTDSGSKTPNVWTEGGSITSLPSVQRKSTAGFALKPFRINRCLLVESRNILLADFKSGAACACIEIAIDHSVRIKAHNRNRMRT
jgi:hypothetical protein